MPPHTYAYGIRLGPDPAPYLVWRFDSRWLRDAVARENPAIVHPAPAADLSRRAARSLRHGYARRVAPGIWAFLYQEPNPPEPFPAIPSLRMPPTLSRAEDSLVHAPWRRGPPAVAVPPGASEAAHAARTRRNP